MSRYAIVRYPCLPEDEGRTFLIKIVATKEEGLKWIAEQKGEYFSCGDYGLMKDVSQ